MRERAAGGGCTCSCRESPRRRTRGGRGPYAYGKQDLEDARGRAVGRVEARVGDRLRGEAPQKRPVRREAFEARDAGVPGRRVDGERVDLVAGERVRSARLRDDDGGSRCHRLERSDAERLIRREVREDVHLRQERRELPVVEDAEEAVREVESKRAQRGIRSLGSEEDDLDAGAELLRRGPASRPR